ncbi:hypothetical protein [Hymenobacter crusticola]|uniref:hypothetical protein n=1 Tax=Hymenobacter crusticola TaxID=1770526 RepID=UPI0015C51DE6|nr:hypothetical protein [Hymenobacter crusticola]
MQKPTINLYTSKPADGGFKALAEFLAQQQPVNLRSLDELPTPRPREKGGQPS